MNENTIYYEVNHHDKIYSLLFSPDYIESQPLESQITEINISDLIWFKDRTGFFCRWGWPGPDYNQYTADTYGKGWAFTKEEIFEAWGKGKGENSE